MNRVINNPGLVVDDMLKGVLAAYPQLEAAAANPRVIKRTCAPIAGKVGIVTGGGAGHEPAFLGYVGENLVDAVAIGEILSSPTANSFFEAFCAADGGKGIACLYGNYAGDAMNVSMALKMAELAGIRVRTVVANDDVASAPKGKEAERRGVAGELLMLKTASACASLGGSLDDVIAIAQKTIDHTRSIGIGLKPFVIPAVGKANFRIGDGKMSIGVGLRGEPGIRLDDVVSADEMASLMVDAVVTDLPFPPGKRVAVLLTGLGATPLMEQYILYASVTRYLGEAGLTVAVPLIGNFFTSLEMTGVALSVLLLDEELERYMKHPCASIGLKQT
ncbi:dihydroxyacetone kinase subunit DhaK [Propionivibrio dicarboxylicus]|uniref:Dihydroxyacetone kinase, N-terminal domain n=1 Tax=Propionivibrio dicarboxylicus TaxID=83767 RepID=A0A1G8JVF2_9RHOO|nr:dihydroxyacetone kinase subunit DhaK [Propionivibrio dicarboxylicus]SDI35209.1 dihydroxyacetone kinase, N-terminal domain [Propionivibrio dicarboxylicus]